MFIFGHADRRATVSGLLRQKGVPGNSSGTEPVLQRLRMTGGERAHGRQCMDWGDCPNILLVVARKTILSCLLPASLGVWSAQGGPRLPEHVRRVLLVSTWPALIGAGVSELKILLQEAQVQTAWAVCVPNS